MGQSAAGLAFYAYIIPFLISTAAGAIISAVLIYSLKKSGVLQRMQSSLDR
jgi:predicted membrane protein